MTDASPLSMTPRVRTLPNGLTVIMETLPHVHSCSMGIWVRAGSANETPEWAGISHFLEHMFFKGTDTRSARDVMYEIESRGGQMNAFTSRETTCLYAKTMPEHVGIALDVLGDIVCHPTYADLDKERNVILEEIATSQDTPDEHVFDLLSTQYWPDHALGRPIAGFETTVGAITKEDVAAYKNTWYRPENMVLVVVGKFDEDEVFAQASEKFSDLQSGEVPEMPTKPAPQAGYRQVEQAIAQDHITMAFPAMPMTDENRYAYDMLSCVLGGGSTSRLFESVREDAGLAYAVYTYHSAYSCTGMLGMYAGIGPENLEKTFGLVGNEFRRIKEELIDTKELESNRAQLKGGLLFALENTFHRMSRLARAWMFFGELIAPEDILQRIDAITAEQLQTLAQDTLQPELCAATVLGPAGQPTVNLDF